MKKMKVNMLRVCAFVSLLLPILFISCSDNEKGMEEIPNVPGEYDHIVVLQSDAGSNNMTKAIINNQFTNEYDADYIYVHSYNESGTDQWVRIPVTSDIPGCYGVCKGFHLCVTITEDGKYQIKGEDENGNEKIITFDNVDDQVYFSSYQSEVWEGKEVDASPISESTVLVRDDNGKTGQGGAHGEIYRSRTEYTISDLLTGTGGLSDAIWMDRKCSAFRIRFMFTDSDYSIRTESEWTEATGTQVSDWTGKIYFGACFGDTYNIETGESTFATNKDGEEKGFYASWNQEYITFEDVSYTVGSGLEGEDDEIYYGYGVSTVATSLVTPYDSEKIGEPMEFYAFVKYQNSDKETDNGAKYWGYKLNFTVPAYNTTNLITIVCNVSDLNAFLVNAGSNMTRATIEPQMIDIQPVKVICVQE